MKSPEGLSSVESREDIEIVREEMRGALLGGACGLDETNGACEDKWFKEYNAEFERAFDQFVLDNENILELWVENRTPIISMFHNKLDDLDIKKDLAA